MNDLEHDLSRSLHEQAARVPAAPLTLDAVRGTARRIHRRRQGLLAAGVAAVLAVVIPSTLLLAPGTDNSAPPPAAPPTVQVVPDHALAGDETLDLSDLPLGASPLTGYLDLTGEPTVVTADGDSVPLQVEGRPLSWTRLDDGRYVVETTDDGTISIEVLTADGARESTSPATGSLVVDQDHRQVAFPNGTEVLVVQSGVEGPRSLGTTANSPDAVSIRLVDLTGSECFVELEPGADDGGCVAYGNVTSADGESEAWGVGTGGDGPVFYVSPFRILADHVNSGKPNWVRYQAGVREVRDDLSTCSGVYGVDEQAPNGGWLIETCDHRFDTFSPDHGSLLAWESYGDGVGHHAIGMYDLATRSLRWQRSATEQGMGFVHSAQWEDDDHVLAPAYQDGSWLLVRFGPDGSMERVTEPARGEDVEPAYLPEVQH